jgi:hypothetical protein
MGRKFEKSNTIYYGPVGEAKPWLQQLPPDPAPRKASDKNVGTIEGDVGVPTLQAFIVAVPLSILGTMLAIMGIMAFELTWWIAPMVLVTVWSGFAGWLAYHNVSKRQQLWQQEISEHRDINGDGYIGPPLEKPTLDVWIHEDNGHGTQSRPFDFGLERDMAAAFCKQILRDNDLSIDTWEKTWIDGRRVFSGRKAFVQLRNRMENAGLIAAKNPHAKNQGFDLTAAGRAVFRKTIKEYSPISEGAS